MRLLLVAMSAAVLAVPATAQRTYRDETTFLGEAGPLPFAVESFETGGAAPGAPIGFAGGSLACSGWCGEFGRTDIAATAGTYSVRFVGPDTVTFTFERAINAFGIDVLGLGSVDPSGLVAQWNGRSSTIYAGQLGSGLNRLFVGVTDENGFSSISLNVTSYGDGVLLDRLQFGAGVLAVPEPATWAMMIVGFGAAGGAMRRSARMRVGPAWNVTRS